MTFEISTKVYGFWRSFLLYWVEMDDASSNLSDGSNIEVESDDNSD